METIVVSVALFVIAEPLGVLSLIICFIFTVGCLWEVVTQISYAYIYRDQKINSVAEKKSYQLLLANLTREQQLDVKRYKCFFVKGGVTGKTYRISTRSDTMNVTTPHSTPGKVYGHCIIPKDREIPKFDAILAQKIMLECDENVFLNLAISFVQARPLGVK